MNEARARGQAEESFCGRLFSCCDAPWINSDTSTDTGKGFVPTQYAAADSGDPTPKGKEKGRDRGRDKLRPLRFESGLPVLDVQLPKVNGSWSWLRESNSQTHRHTRQEAGKYLQEAFRQGGYAMQVGSNVQKVSFRRLQQMLINTRTISVSKGLPALEKSPGHRTVFLHGGNPIQLAAELTQEGLRPAAVNAASAYHAGGGFTSGGRHALEEAFCSQSTLYPSLQQVVGAQSGKQTYIPEDGVIISPDVEIFRKGTDQGYALQMKPVAIAAVISVAMYNKNHNVRDAPVDAPEDNAAYELGTQHKLQALVHAAVLSNADALVLPDVGCGVFRNDARLVGRLTGEILLKYADYFKKIVFTGQDAFFQEAMAVLPSMAKTQSGKLKSKAGAKVGGFKGCLVCGKSVAGSSEIALLMGPTGRRAEGLQFLHNTCIAALAEIRPDHTAITLPQAEADPSSFLRALDVDGNGTLSKDEVHFAIAALWDGSREELERAFEAKWEEWDVDASNTLSVEEASQIPQSLADWVHECARKDGIVDKSASQPEPASTEVSAGAPPAQAEAAPAGKPHSGRT